MISEGSCDTEDWSNDAEIQLYITGINYIYLKYTEQNYKRNTFVFAPIFSWAELKDLRHILCTQRPISLKYCSQSV